MDPTRFAVVDDSGIVTNVIVAADLATAASVAGNVVPDLNIKSDIGFTWDGTNFIGPTLQSTVTQL